VISQATSCHPDSASRRAASSAPCSRTTASADTLSPVDANRSLMACAATRRRRAFLPMGFTTCPSAGDTKALPFAPGTAAGAPVLCPCRVSFETRSGRIETPCCWRRPNIEPPCRLNFEPGKRAGFCGRAVDKCRSCGSCLTSFLC
jgi:hypothetical protein